MFTTTSANSWLLSILCLVLTNISIIFCATVRALLRDLAPQKSNLTPPKTTPGTQNPPKPHPASQKPHVPRGTAQGHRNTPQYIPKTTPGMGHGSEHPKAQTPHVAPQNPQQAPIRHQVRDPKNRDGKDGDGMGMRTGTRHKHRAQRQGWGQTGDRDSTGTGTHYWAQGWGQGRAQGRHR